MLVSITNGTNTASDEILHKQFHENGLSLSYYRYHKLIPFEQKYILASSWSVKSSDEEAREHKNKELIFGRDFNYRTRTPKA
jgi:hypothetical protein